MSLSRRRFLAITGAATLTPYILWETGKFPSSLDHIILGCDDLASGVALVEERTGVRAALGGVHPDRGTANALLSFGEDHYLEILAPDPNAKSVQPSAVQQVVMLKGLSSPRLMNWAVHTKDIDGLATKLRNLGVQIVGPLPGSRKRPDGRVLSWKRLVLADDLQGVLPFFIEWSAASIHPSSDSPKGCNLDRWAAADKNSQELSNTFHKIGIDMLVEQNEKPQLRARLAGPRGVLAVTS